jgi:FMN phosphatase YigB (HAD superfamily)
VEIRYLLWDFGDTLADERFLWTSPTGVPGWTDCYRDLAGGEFGSRWNRGLATFDELAAEMSARLAMSTTAVVAHARRCCQRIRFFEHSWAVARSHELPQALVTVNADVFRNVVMANYPLGNAFDVVVISAEEGTEDKTDLCDLALARLGCDDRSEALLIDNLAVNVEAWRARGGAAYWFRSDADFASQFAAGSWDTLAQAT